MLIDRLVLKGTVIDFLTDFFQEYQKYSSFRDLMVLLSNARMDSKLEECFPPSQRDKQTFIKHFKDHNLPELVEWYVKRSQDNAIQRLQAQLIELTSSNPPADASEVQELISSEV